MTEVQRKKTSTVLILIVTVFAFYNSYMHGVAMVRAHAPSGSPFGSDYGVAAIPELILIGSVLRGADWRSIGAGSISVLWTLWVNVSASAGGASGLIVALVPPLAALILLGLSEHGSGIKAKAGSRKVSTAQKNGSMSRGSAAQPAGSRVKVDAPAVGSRKLIAAAETAHGSRITAPVRQTKTQLGIEWMNGQEGTPSIREIMLAVGVSEATAKRIRASKTGKTASEKVAQNG
jgi:hypothetical protein